MTYGSEPRRRRWSSDSSRRANESRLASEDEDAENWLAGFRPDPSEAEADGFSGVAPAFSRPPEASRPSSPEASRPSSPEASRPSSPGASRPSSEEVPERRGRRRRADPEPPVELRPEPDLPWEPQSGRSRPGRRFGAAERDPRDFGAAERDPRDFGAAERDPRDFGAAERDSRDEPVSGGFRAAPEAPAPGRRPAPEAPTGRRPAPEAPTGRRSTPTAPTGRRAAPAPNDWGAAPTTYGSAPDQPWAAPVEPRSAAGNGPQGASATAPGLPAVDPTRPAWTEAWHERAAAVAAERGRHSAPVGPVGPAEPQDDDRIGGGFRPTDRSPAFPPPAFPPPAFPPRDERPGRGRRRAPEPDDGPTGGRLPTDFSARSATPTSAAPAVPIPPPPVAPTRTTATASIPVRTTPQPPIPPVTQEPAPPSRRRATASARVAPPGTGRPPTSDDTRRRATEDSGAIRRRATEDSGAIRRRATEDSGAIRRRFPDGSTGRAGSVSAQTAGQRASATRLTGSGGARSTPTWVSRVLIVVTVVVLALVAFGGYMLINSGGSNPPAKQPASGAVFKGRDITSRDIDPAAMTEQEIFPANKVAVSSAVYPVLKTQAADCQTAATDDLAKLLGDLGCSQVVRGTLKSPDSQFLITAGIFNLKDESSANKAYETIKPTLDAQKGRFTGLAAGDGTEAIVRAPTTLGWHPLGHFLAYCIVARADGKAIAADDPGSKQVISDVVEGYLRDNVLAARAAGPPSTPK